MEDESDVRAELAELEVKAVRLSAIRSRLQDQIDYGYASDATRAREREISAERRLLHRQIDSLRQLLDLSPGPPKKDEPLGVTGGVDI